MAGLALTRKKEDGLTIFMLHTGERFTRHLRDIHLLLAGRMGVQPDTDLIRRGFDLGAARPLPEQIGDAGKVFWH